MDSFPKRSWTKEIHTYLQEVVPSRKGLVCFDFDNTLIRNDFGEKIMDQILREGMAFLPEDLSPYFRDRAFWKNHKLHPIQTKETLIWEEYAYQLKEFGIEAGYRWTSFIFQGLDRQRFYEISKRAWDRVSLPDPNAGVYPQPEMLDLISFLYKHSWEVYIVTASPEPGIAAISHVFPVAEDHVIGMRQEIGEKGIYQTKLVEPYTYGEGKVKAIQSRIGRIPDLSFGDSFNDFPMLCYAKQGIAIDRGNPEFVSACQNKHIFIQPYFLPVSE